jgi:hypothetical protein
MLDRLWICLDPCSSIVQTDTPPIQRIKHHQSGAKFSQLQERCSRKWKALANTSEKYVLWTHLQDWDESYDTIPYYLIFGYIWRDGHPITSYLDIHGHRETVWQMGLSHSPFHVNGVLKWQGRSCSHPVYFALLIQNERHAITGVCLNGQDLCILLEISAQCVLSVMYPVADTFLQRRLVGGFKLFCPLFPREWSGIIRVCLITGTIIMILCFITMFLLLKSNCWVYRYHPVPISRHSQDIFHGSTTNQGWTLPNRKKKTNHGPFSSGTWSRRKTSQARSRSGVWSSSSSLEILE